MQTIKKGPSVYALRHRFYAIAIVAGAVHFLSVFLQYTTTSLDHGWLAYAFILANLLCAGALVWSLLPLPWDRPTFAGWGGVAYLGVTSLLVFVIKLSCQSVPNYSLPRTSLAYELPHREVTLLTSDGVRLKGTYIKLGHPTAVLVYPGWLSTRDSFAVVTLAQWLAARHDVLVLDPRGQGKSAGVQDAPGNSKFDFLAGVSFLRGEGARKVGVLAETDGAYPAILAASEQRTIDSLALASPVGRWGMPSFGEGFWRDPGNFVGRWIWKLGLGVRLRGGESRPTAEIIPGVSPVPLLLLETTHDSHRIASQLHLVARDPRSIVLLPGDGRPIGWPQYEKYAQAVGQWFQMTLSERPDASASVQ